MTRTLDNHTLNRTTLHRQHLLQRVAGPVESVLTHLVGLQGQNPLDPYYGLWSRVERFDPAQLADMVDDGRVQRGALMRATIHLVTSEDWNALRPVFQPVCRRTLDSTQFARDTAELNRDQILGQARDLLLAEPTTRAELGRRLAEHFPGIPSGSLGQVATYLLPVTQPPPRAVWGKKGQAKWRVTEPGSARDIESTTDELVIRYLASLGPASVKDLRAWSGLTGAAGLVNRVRHRLRTYRDESGAELYDIEDGEIIDPGVSAPPRFLPEYDNVLLGHADRTRVFEGQWTPEGWLGNLLVDGFFAGHWKLDEAGLSVTVRAPVIARQRVEIGEEAEYLFHFARPEADTRNLRIEFDT